jgi:hypothetical protein
MRPANVLHRQQASRALGRSVNDRMRRRTITVRNKAGTEESSATEATKRTPSKMVEQYPVASFLGHSRDVAMRLSLALCERHLPAQSVAVALGDGPDG